MASSYFVGSGHVFSTSSFTLLESTSFDSDYICVRIFGTQNNEFILLLKERHGDSLFLTVPTNGNSRLSKDSQKWINVSNFLLRNEVIVKILPTIQPVAILTSLGRYLVASDWSSIVEKEPEGTVQDIGFAENRVYKLDCQGELTKYTGTSTACTFVACQSGVKKLFTGSSSLFTLKFVEKTKELGLYKSNTRTPLLVKQHGEPVQIACTNAQNFILTDTDRLFLIDGTSYFKCTAVLGTLHEVYKPPGLVVQNIKYIRCAFGYNLAVVTNRDEIWLAGYNANGELGCSGRKEALVKMEDDVFKQKFCSGTQLLDFQFNGWSSLILYGPKPMQHTLFIQMGTKATRSFLDVGISFT